MNAYLRDTLSDPGRDKEQDHLEGVINPKQPTTEFYLVKPGWKEVKEFVEATRSASALDPTSVPYNVHKSYPRLLRLFF